MVATAKQLGNNGDDTLLKKSASDLETVPGAEILYAVPFLYNFACFCPRLAILTLYLRVFPTRPERIASYIAIGLTVAYTVGGIVATSQVCHPIEKLWNSTLPGRCSYAYTWFEYIPLPNLVFDVFMLLIPLPGVWKLQTGLAMKIGLTITFLVGSL